MLGQGLYRTDLESTRTRVQPPGTYAEMLGMVVPALIPAKRKRHCIMGQALGLTGTLKAMRTLSQGAAEASLLSPRALTYRGGGWGVEQGWM